MTARIVLLVTTPGVRPGLLTWQAWRELQGAARVLAASSGHPLLPALSAAGIGWEVLPAGPARSGGEVAERLVAAAAQAGGTVVWLCDPGAAEPAGPGAAEPAGPAALAAALARRDGPAAEILTGAEDLPGGWFLRLVAVMDRLRADCPWDARQTHESLAPHLLEEPYEALEALESGDPAALREELGDMLLQVVFHARIAAERTDGTGYTIDDVTEGIVTKLVRRHPHVFGDVTVSGHEEVRRNWDAIKAAEREAAAGRAASALDGIPFGQPALQLATQLQRRAERAGAPAELADLAGDGGALGAELFAMVARARAAGADPELELRAAARRYRDRVRAWEESRRS